MKAKKLRNVVGIDISSTVAGVSVLDEDQNLLFWKWYNFKKNDDLDDIIDLGFFFEDIILEELKEYNPFYFSLEDRLKSFSGGRTSNTTIMKLAKVNGLVEYIISKQYGKERIQKHHPMTARKNSFLKRGRSPQGIDVKDWVIKNTMEKYPELEFPVKTRSRKNPKPFIDEASDVCDSIVLASCFKR